MTNLSIPQAALALGVSRATVYREIAAGRLRTFKIRGRTFVARRELDAYLAHREGRRVA